MTLTTCCGNINTNAEPVRCKQNAMEVATMKYDYSVFIGRFQPVHSGHVHIARKALEHSRFLIIGIGSANLSNRTTNPFSYCQRADLWRERLSGEERGRVIFVYLNDMLYSDNDWVSHVRFQINDVIASHGIIDPDDAKIALTGHQKDHTSYYLRYFPTWSSEFIDDAYEQFSSTEIREFIFNQYVSRNAETHLRPDMFFGNKHLRGLQSDLFWTKEYQEIMRDLAGEWDFDVNYDPTQYHVNVLTVDAVVVQNGHVLVVNRKYKPGMGLRALPGGHIGPTETLEDAMLRELREETRIDRSDRILRSNIKAREVFDHPSRSTRARVITTAFLIVLPDEEKLPKVKGSDDASRAFWMPLSDVKAQDFFEDHAFIIEKLTAGL